MLTSPPVAFRNLHERMTAAGHTEQSLAKAAGYSHTAARDLFHGKSKRPRHATLAAFAKVLRCEVSDLLDGDYVKRFMSNPPGSPPPPPPRRVAPPAGTVLLQLNEYVTPYQAACIHEVMKRDVALDDVQRVVAALNEVAAVPT